MVCGPKDTHIDVYYLYSGPKELDVVLSGHLPLEDVLIRVE